MRKRDSPAIVGCESGEADPVDHGENLLLRSSAPTFSRVRSLRDPDADDPHGSSADKVVWKMMLFGQREVRGRRMKKGGRSSRFTRGLGGLWGIFIKTRISNWGLSVCLFYDVVVPKPPSERIIWLCQMWGHTKWWKEPCGMND